MEFVLSEKATYDHANDGELKRGWFIVYSINPAIVLMSVAVALTASSIYLIKTINVCF